MHILSPETDNCPSWISGRERMTVENISWSISTKECCRPRRGLNPRPPGLQSDGASNWVTEAGMARVLVHPSLNSLEAVEGTCDQLILLSDRADANLTVGIVVCWLSYHHLYQCLRAVDTLVTYSSTFKIEGKAMIRNRCNYPTPPIRDIKVKETQTRNN